VDRVEGVVGSSIAQCAVALPLARCQWQRQTPVISTVVIGSGSFSSLFNSNEVVAMRWC
jgi:hypothetical protein